MSVLVIVGAHRESQVIIKLGLDRSPVFLYSLMQDNYTYLALENTMRMGLVTTWARLFSRHKTRQY